MEKSKLKLNYQKGMRIRLQSNRDFKLEISALKENNHVDKKYTHLSTNCPEYKSTLMSLFLTEP